MKRIESAVHNTIQTEVNGHFEAQFDAVCQIKEAVDKMFSVSRDVNQKSTMLLLSSTGNAPVKMQVNELYKVLEKTAQEAISAAVLCHKYLNSPYCK